MFATACLSMINAVTQVQIYKFILNENVAVIQKNFSIPETWWLSGQNIIMASSTAKWSTTAAIEKQITEYAQTLFSSEWPNGQYYNWMDAIYNNYTSSPDQK